jgi:hypothetical protein
MQGLRTITLWVVIALPVLSTLVACLTAAELPAPAPVVRPRSDDRCGCLLQGFTHENEAY